MCDYLINISAVAMTSLQIVKTPDKTTYWQGETLDTTGMVVQKVMNNGTTEEVALGNAALSVNYDFSTVGTQAVTLSYNDFSASFNCTVKAIEVTGIDIIEEPYKTLYVEGATLDTDGLKVQTTLSNGGVATITAADSNLSFVYDFSSAGTQTVTVKYGNYTDSFACEVYTYEDYLKTVTNISVESVKGCAGNTVTVDIVINNNTGILAAAFNVTYDSALTLIDVEGGEALSTLTLTKPGTLNSPCTFAWDGINDVDATNGTILTLTFVISEEAVTGEAYEISVSYVDGNVINGAFENVEVATISGGVTVIDYVPGDLSGDGVVNMADVVNLRRYIVGGYDLSINLDAADVNNDGSINMADVVLIRRYVVGGYDVELQ